MAEPRGDPRSAVGARSYTDSLQALIRSGEKLYFATTYDQKLHSPNRVFQVITRKTARELEGRPASELRPGENLCEVEPEFSAVCARVWQDRDLPPQPIDVWIRAAVGYWVRMVGTVSVEDLYIDFDYAPMWVFEAAIVEFEQRRSFPDFDAMQMKAEDSIASALTHQANGNALIEQTTQRIHQSILPGTPDKSAARRAAFLSELLELFKVIDQEQIAGLEGKERVEGRETIIQGKVTLTRVQQSLHYSQGTVQTRMHELAAADGHAGERPRATLLRLYTDKHEVEWKTDRPTDLSN